MGGAPRLVAKTLKATLDPKIQNEKNDFSDRYQFFYG